MKRTISTLLLVILSTASTIAAENPIYNELVEKGVEMSNGELVALPPPIVPDGLDAAGQQAAMKKATDARTTLKDLLKKTPYAPVMVKVRSAQVDPSKDDGPMVRKIDLWFVTYGDWDVMTSKDFLESTLQSKDEEANRVVLRAGELTKAELDSRQLTAITTPELEERFLYSTFRMFDRVQVGATRFSALTRDENSILAAGRLDPRFLDDPEYPNEWRPLLRNPQAEIEPGPAHPFAHAGGYAKITRLIEPAGAVWIECHIVFEEPYGWFDGVNLIRQKIPVMVNEKIKVFRRKLMSASDESE